MTFLNTKKKWISHEIADETDVFLTKIVKTAYGHEAFLGIEINRTDIKSERTETSLGRVVVGFLLEGRVGSVSQLAVRTTQTPPPTPPLEGRGVPTESLDFQPHSTKDSFWGMFYKLHISSAELPSLQGEGRGWGLYLHWQLE